MTPIVQLRKVFKMLKNQKYSLIVLFRTIRLYFQNVHFLKCTLNNFGTVNFSFLHKHFRYFWKLETSLGSLLNISKKKWSKKFITIKIFVL